MRVYAASAISAQRGREEGRGGGEQRTRLSSSAVGEGGPHTIGPTNPGAKHKGRDCSASYLTSCRVHEESRSSHPPRKITLVVWVGSGIFFDFFFFFFLSLLSKISQFNIAPPPLTLWSILFTP